MRKVRIFIVVSREVVRVKILDGLVAYSHVKNIFNGQINRHKITIKTKTIHGYVDLKLPFPAYHSV